MHKYGGQKSMSVNDTQRYLFIYWMLIFDVTWNVVLIFDVTWNIVLILIAVHVQWSRLFETTFFSSMNSDN